MEIVLILGAAALATLLVWREMSARRSIAALRQELDAARQQLGHREQLASIGQLISGLAQELKSPLQSVIGNTELMIATAAAGGESQEELRDIQQNANRAAGIVRNLLAFSDTKTIDRRWQDLNNIVERAIEGCQAELQAAGVRVDVQRADRLPLVYVDGPQLEKMVATLLGRSAKASHAMEREASAGRRVTLATRRRTDVDDRLVIEVDDRTAPAAMEPSWNDDLEACRRIVDAHGGSLEVEHPPGGGFRVHMELPVKSVETYG